MKAEQSSLYRHLEMLHLWCIEVFENAPKQPMMQEDVRLLAENIVSAQSAVAIALDTKDLRQRLDLIDVVVLNITSFKSITKVITEYSSNPNRRMTVISKSQRIRMLELMSSIGEELGRWRNKTAFEYSKANSSLPK